MSTNGNTITVEIDPTAPIPEQVVGHNEDGPIYGPMSMQDAIVKAAANQLVAKIERKAEGDIGKEVSEKLDTLIANRLPALVEEALSKEIVVTDKWGNEQHRGTLHQQIVNEIQKQLKVDGRPFHETALDNAVREHIGYVLKGELAGQVKQAKAELLDRLKQATADELAEAVVKAVTERR